MTFDEQLKESDRPLELLKELYAIGEIDAEEFNKEIDLHYDEWAKKSLNKAVNVMAGMTVSQASF